MLDYAMLRCPSEKLYTGFACFTWLDTVTWPENGISRCSLGSLRHLHTFTAMCTARKPKTKDFHFSPLHINTTSLCQSFVVIFIPRQSRSPRQHRSSGLRRRLRQEYLLAAVTWAIACPGPEACPLLACCLLHLFCSPLLCMVFLCSLQQRRGMFWRRPACFGRPCNYKALQHVYQPCMVQAR